MAGTSSILSYVKNVVSDYDPSTKSAGYRNVNVTTNLDSVGITAEDTQTDELTVGGIKYPTKAPTTDGMFIAYNSVNANLEFRDPSTQLTTVDTIGGLIISNSAGLGSIIHMNAINIDPTLPKVNLAAVSETESLIIDAKPIALKSTLKLSDRMLISIDRPAGALLHRITLRDLFQFLENASIDVSRISAASSNTYLDALDTFIKLNVEDPTGTEKASRLDKDGFSVNGNTYFITNVDTNKNNAVMRPTSTGYMLTRYNNDLDIEFEGLQNFTLRNDLIQFGSNFTVGNNSYIDVDDFSSMYLNSNATFRLHANTILDIMNDASLVCENRANVIFTGPLVYNFDQNLETTSNTSFNQITITDSEDAAAIGQGSLVVHGGASIYLDAIIGNDLTVINDLVAGNDLTVIGALSADSLNVTSAATVDSLSVTTLTSTNNLNVTELTTTANLTVAELTSTNNLNVTTLTTTGQLDAVDVVADNVTSDYGTFSLSLSANGTNNYINGLVLTNGVQIDNGNIDVMNGDLFISTGDVTGDNVTARDTVASPNLTASVGLNSYDANVSNTLFATNIYYTNPPVVASSMLYKENINTFESGLQYVMNMKPVQYDRKNKLSMNEIGFIAEEMETILPNVVKDGRGIKGIQYDQIIPVLVSAMQEQQRKIDELENKLNKY